MNTETYLQRMAELGVSRGKFDQDNAFPPDFGSQISQHLQSPYINGRASMKVRPPPLNSASADDWSAGRNRVAMLLFGGGFRKYRRLEKREELLAQARAVAHTPLERFYVLLFERESSTAALAQATGWSVTYICKLVRRGWPTASRQRLQEYLTAEERAALGWDEWKPSTTDERG